MNNTDFYSTIFKRKSVRKFARESIDASRLESLQNFIKDIIPLYGDIRTEIAILSENDVKSILPIKAPHYVVAYSEAKEGYLVNVGFMLQQVDLYLSANGIGACWLGMGSPQKEAASRNGLEYIIALPFGGPEEPVHRESKAEFKRKALSEITDIKGAEELLEAVRLAPSASNSQPWFFTGSADNIIVCRSLPNLLKAALYGKFNRIDMGIALCHLRIAALNMGKNIEFGREDAAVPKGHEYITTAHIK